MNRHCQWDDQTQMASINRIDFRNLLFDQSRLNCVKVATIQTHMHRVAMNFDAPQTSQPNVFAGRKAALQYFRQSTLQRNRGDALNAVSFAARVGASLNGCSDRFCQIKLPIIVLANIFGG